MGQHRQRWSDTARMRGLWHSRRHHDEFTVKINGGMHCLWRAVC